jgi:hypothetical protein
MKCVWLFALITNEMPNTLYDLILEHVVLPSTILTDAWRGYNGLLAGGFANHLTVNHSLFCRSNNPRAHE